MSTEPICWQRAVRHNLAVGKGDVEVAYFRGVALVAYRAPIGPLCIALNKTFMGESIEDAKKMAEEYVKSASQRLLDERHISLQSFRQAYVLGI